MLHCITYRFIQSQQPRLLPKEYKELGKLYSLMLIIISHPSLRSPTQNLSQLTSLESSELQQGVTRKLILRASSSESELHVRTTQYFLKPLHRRFLDRTNKRKIPSLDATNAAWRERRIILFDTFLTSFCNDVGTIRHSSTAQFMNF